MSQIRELLIDQVQDLLSGEEQLIEALPKMAAAAKHPKLRVAFELHLAETEAQAERLRLVCDALGAERSTRVCQGMAGLIQAGEDVMQRSAALSPLAADLALIAAAQKVEHLEIAGYGTARGLARQLREFECARLLSQSLGEEESTDYLLTMISDPLIQQQTLDDAGSDVSLERISVGIEERGMARGRAVAG